VEGNLVFGKRIIILEKVFPKKKKYFVKKSGCLYCEDILTKIWSGMTNLCCWMTMLCIDITLYIERERYTMLY